MQLSHALAALAADEPEQRLAAIAQLERLGDLQALPALVNCMQRDTDPQVQAEAARVARALSQSVTDNPRDPFGQFRI